MMPKWQLIVCACSTHYAVYVYVELWVYNVRVHSMFIEIGKILFTIIIIIIPSNFEVYFLFHTISLLSLRRKIDRQLQQHPFICRNYGRFCTFRAFLNVVEKLIVCLVLTAYTIYNTRTQPAHSTNILHKIYYYFTVHTVHTSRTTLLL